MYPLPSTAPVRLHRSPFMTEPVRQLYLSAFPPEERRPLHLLEHMVSSSDAPVSLFVAESEGKFAGFITLWQLDDSLFYVEHFATVPSLRGRGLGAAILADLRRLLPEGTTVVLEVEKPDNDMACRRIGFYTRSGFRLHDDYVYIQPPYSSSLHKVEMKLMTCGDDDQDIADIATRLRSIVYNCR